MDQEPNVQPILGAHPSQGVVDTHVYSQGQFRIDNSPTSMFLEGERNVENQEIAYSDPGKACKTPQTLCIAPVCHLGLLTCTENHFMDILH